MNFGEAIECMKKGSVVTRKSWNGKQIFHYKKNIKFIHM